MKNLTEIQWQRKADGNARYFSVDSNIARQLFKVVGNVIYYWKAANFGDDGGFWLKDHAMTIDLLENPDLYYKRLAFPIHDMRMWLSDFKINYPHPHFSASKWVIGSQVDGNGKTIYYKLEMDNVNFGHEFHGVILLNYEQAVDVVGILNSYSEGTML